ncbi:MAG TPA: 16S rRNA processing protein RimM [Campylobacterales bacterium]|nr:16S rRNA processing protein RimM [Campylobacterales bacterium]
MKSDRLQIATIGKVVGLWGELKLHLQSDFEDQFKIGSRFVLTNGSTIEIENYNHAKSLVKFIGFNVREDAQKLTNQKLFTTVEATRENCSLEEGQFFWFDVVGSLVYDGDTFLGTVDEIERIGAVDYLVIKTAEDLVEKEHSIKFYIPYIDEYIKNFDIENKKIETEGGLLLLEAS